MDSLQRRIGHVTARALRDGALVSIPTRTVVVEDVGVDFAVHVSDLQESKALAKELQRANDSNPFLPPDPDLFITDLPPRHAAVLNKFNVLDHHLLVVTRSFEPQEDLLNRGDFAALGRCMNEIDGLGFYNGGTVAGASQPHKHLQLAPLPIGSGRHPTPLDAIIDRRSADPGPTTIPGLPFTHAVVHLDGRPISEDRADELVACYRSVCAAVGVHDTTTPYNMLLTRRWMLVAPRAGEHWRRISINSLGFAGSLLVRNTAELDELRRAGPMAVLRSVVEPHASTTARLRCHDAPGEEAP